MKQHKSGQLGLLTPKRILLAIVAQFIFTRRLVYQHNIRHRKKTGESEEEKKQQQEMELQKKRLERQKAMDCKLFEKDDQARWYAKRMCRDAVRDFLKHDVIPAGFYHWLRASKIIPQDSAIPPGGSTVEQLIQAIQQSNVDAYQLLTYLQERRQFHIKTYCNPELNRAFITHRGIG